MTRAAQARFHAERRRGSLITRRDDGSTLTVPADFLGDWAVHAETSSKWNVSHGPTGLAVAKDLSRDKAERLLNALWREGVVLVADPRGEFPFSLGTSEAAVEANRQARTAIRLLVDAVRGDA